MKKHLKIIMAFIFSSILSACSNLNLHTTTSSQNNQNVVQHIPDSFAGKWVNKKKPNHSYCNPKSGSFEQVIWIIKPKQNYLELLTWSEYRIRKFSSLTKNAFTADVEVKSQDIDPDSTAEITTEKLSAKLISNNAIIINSKRYYRCP